MPRSRDESTAGSDAQGRILVTKLGLDGHDVGAKVIARLLRDRGFEVIFLGIRQTPDVVAAVAVDEDVDLIGVSILSGAHVPLVSRLMGLLGERQWSRPVVVGGVIPEADRAVLTDVGVAAIVDAAATSAEIVDTVGRLIHADQRSPAAMQIPPMPGLEGTEPERAAFPARGEAMNESRGAPTNDRLPVGYGVRLPNSGPFATAPAIVAVTRQAERAGFDAVWVHDHIPWARAMLTHFSTGSIEACDRQDPNFFETVASAAFVAGLCPDIDVGIAGLVLPLRDPRVLAKQLMTTQVLTGGRLITALAIGNVPNDFEVMQVPFNRRGRITDDFLGALEAIYTEGASTYRGDGLEFRDAEFFPKPVDNRFWIAGNSPPAYRRIARYATGWLPGGLSPAGYRDSLARVEGVLESHGRDVTTLERGVELYLCLAATHEEAVTIAARSLEHRFSTVERGLERNIIGGPDAVLEKIDAYVQAGVTHFELRVVAHTLDAHLEMLDRFRADVMPQAATQAAF